MLKTFLSAATVILLLQVQPAYSAEAPTSLPTVTAEDLPRVPATEPGNALKTMHVRPGFHLELAAHEPNVVDPIAMCFDERGRMFVIEMIDYSERREEKLSRIRLLEDADNDGVYEKSTIFLDNLAWATAVFWYDGGLLVGATPDIIYAKDTDNDGVADTREVLFTGFASEVKRVNVQALFNNLNWGLDNRIHGCSGLNGGMVQAVKHPDKPPVNVRGRGFVIDPRDWSITTENGGGQYGLSFDPWGRLYTCSNSVHIETFMYDDRYLKPSPLALPAARQCIAVDGPAAEVFRASPEEPWRVIRTRWRIGGIVKGAIEGGGRSAGYFTGATGITIYRGDAFGPEYVGDAFTGDAGGNLVHHKRIRRGGDGIELLAERPADEKKIEFVASTDNWFRPVDFANAPDGTLYIADMYRETIEHPWSIPPELKQFLDLNSGNDRGRIWRIAPNGFTRPERVDLSKASTDELVMSLKSKNGWIRETAHRLIFEHKDRQAIPMLESLVRSHDQPLAQLHALHLLDGLHAMEPKHLLVALDAPDAAVRTHAIRMVERAEEPLDEQMRSKLASLAEDPDPAVRYQLAFTLGVTEHPDRADLLTRILAQSATSRWMQTAYLTSIGDDGAEQFEGVREVLLDKDATTSAFLGELAMLIGAQASPDEVDRLLSAIASIEDPAVSLDIAQQLAAGMATTKQPLRSKPTAQPLFEHARTLATDKAAKTPARVAAVRLLRHDEFAAASPIAARLLAQAPQPVQLAALQTLDGFNDPQVAPLVLSQWPEMSPRMKSEAVSVLMNRPERAIALLKAVEGGSVAANDISGTQGKVLRTSANSQVKQLAVTLLPDRSAERAKVFEELKSAIAMKGDAAKGHVLYQKLCISCHRAGDEGFPVGPDMVTVKNSGAEKLLLSIVDPNREVAPQYVSFLVDTTDGKSLLGVIASDTPASLTLREAYGKETVIPRDQIKRMTSSGQSIMPEGLETGLQPQDVANLLQFIAETK